MTANTPETLIALLRAKYPEPTSINEAPEDDYGSKIGYCVGGAFCHHIGEDNINMFPTQGSINHALRRHNPRLTYEMADSFAEAIMTSNDLSEFELAWHHLESAISYGA